METHLMTAKDGSPRTYAQAMQKELDPQAAPVVARVNVGRWIADCECNGAELVEPGNPRFFCFSCNNRAYGGKARPVIFPKEHILIEQYLLQLRDDTQGVPERYMNWMPEELKGRYFMAEVPQGLLDEFGTLAEHLEKHLTKEGLHGMG